MGVMRGVYLSTTLTIAEIKEPEGGNGGHKVPGSNFGQNMFIICTSQPLTIRKVKSRFTIISTISTTHDILDPLNTYLAT